MRFTLQFYVRSISSEPFERFIVNFTQMSLSVKRCAEPMNRVCRLKVKFNFQGHGMYPLQCDSIPLLYQIWQENMFKLNPLHFSVRSISPEPFERFSLNFTQMFLSMRQGAEHMTQLCSLEINATVQGHGMYS